MRTVTSIRRELGEIERELYSIDNSLIFEYIGSDYLDRIRSKQKTIQFLTEHHKRRAVYNYVRKTLRRLFK